MAATGRSERIPASRLALDRLGGSWMMAALRRVYKRGDVKQLSGLLSAGWIGLSSTAASAGAWKYDEDSRGHPQLQYLEGSKATFFIGCGRAFGLHVHYPGNA